jgi:hypothetical protein
MKLRSATRAGRSLLIAPALKEDISEHHHDVSQVHPSAADETDELKRRLEDLSPELFSMIYDFTFAYYLPPPAPDEVIRTFRLPV